MKKGKVYLVGAGCGDLGLLTIKGQDILTKADVVVYDSLIGDSILGLIPSTARIIFVGKRSSHHTMQQEDINQILLEEAQKGYKVVRLKGGDPFLFGRGGEELELLPNLSISHTIWIFSLGVFIPTYFRKLMIRKTMRIKYIFVNINPAQNLDNTLA